MKIIEKSKIIDIDKIDNWKDNARDIKPEDLERLKSQIKELGVYKPLLCEIAGDRYITLGGNMRLRALRELKIKQVWITVIEVKDEAERVKISLSDNDRAGFYVEDLLADQLKGLDINLDDFKVDLKTPDTSLATLLNRINSKDQIPDVDIQGEVENKGEYLILQFDDAETVNAFRDKIGLKATQKVIQFSIINNKYKII